jgi:hypothetical protein
MAEVKSGRWLRRRDLDLTTRLTTRYHSLEQLWQRFAGDWV